MDIVELLVLAAFFILPLIQALLEKLGPGRRRQLPPDREERPREEPARGAERPAPVATREAPVAVDERGAGVELEQGWSAGWGSWPSEERSLEDLSAEEVVSEETAAEIVERQERLEDEIAVSEAARVTVPVVSMEPLSVDRGSRASRRPARSEGRVAPATTVGRRRERPSLPGLSSRSEVRRAIVLAEVLGPPRALQPAERMPEG